MDKLIRSRNSDSHKGNYGKISIIAGSRGMTGAAYLASMSALRTGTGLVYTLIAESLEVTMSIKLTEAIIRPIYDKGNGHFIKESLEEILENISGKDAAALGPGLGIDEERVLLVENIISQVSIPLVIDADALNCISCNINMLEKKKSPLVITPHIGEMARLLGKDINVIAQNKEYYASKMADKYNIVVVLKDYKTIVASSSGGTYINATGNPGMATAGSGDVLTGMITSLIGQGLDTFDAAKLGVYLHGMSGDIAKAEKGEYGLIASDIMESIPYAINKIIKNS